LSTDRFIDLPVIQIGKPIIPIILPILDFSNSKFKFKVIFDRFYRFSR
jgi:hypothetical protein